MEISRDQHQQELELAKAQIAELEQKLKLAQKSLETIKEANATYLDLAEVILIEIDDQARITMVGGKGCELIGYSSDELIGQNWFKVCLPPDSYEKVFSVYKNLMAGRTENIKHYENEILTKSGETRQIAWHNTLLRGPDGKIIGTLSSGIDITDRKLVENRFRESEVLLNKVQEVAHIGTWDWNTTNNTAKLSPELYRIYGLSPDQFDGDIATLSKVIHPEDWDKVVKTQELTVEEGRPQQTEFRIIRQDGSIRHVWGAGINTYDEDGVVVRTIGFVQDITEQKKIEDELRESESRYRMIVETAQEGIWAIDTNNNTSFVNPVMALMLGYSVDEMQGRSLFDFVDDEGRQIATDNIERRKAGISEQHDFKFIRKDEAIIWAELNTSPLLDSNNDYLGALAMVTDVTERRYADQALRNTQDLLLKTEALAQVGSWDWEFVSNKVQWSPEMYRIYQYDPIEYPEIDFSLAMTRVYPEDVKKIEDYVQKLLETEIVSPIEYRILVPDGSVRYLWSECQVIDKNNNPKSHMIGFVQDITDRVRAEAALREGNKRFKVLFDQSSFGVAKIDSNTNCFVEINQRYCDILGYSHEEMLSMDFKKITFPDDLQADLDNMAKLKAGEITSFQMEKRYLDKEGFVVWVNLSVMPLWVQGKTPDFHLAIVEDITKRKRAEETLQRQKEEQQLINSIADAVIVIDEQGLIQTFSKSAEAMFGYSVDKIKGRPVNMLMPESDAKKHDKYLSDYIASDISRLIGAPREVNGKRKSGEVFPIRLSVAELPRSAKGLRRFIGACHDMTFEKQQEEQLRRSQKMDALGKLTGGIAHDYNNMLGVVIGYAQLLKDALNDEPELSQYVYEIQHASERGSTLSRKLLGFSRNTQPQADCVDVNEMLLAERDMLQKTLTPRVNLELDLVESSWPIYVNSGEFEDAILNLCINAMQAMTSGGKLIISTSNQTLNFKEASKFKLNSGEYLLVTATDTGIGIDTNDLSYIFDPFFTTKGESGIGLGLSMVYGFVQRSAGAIVVESEKGYGSQFKLYFPRYDQSSPKKPEVKTYSIGKLKGNEKILVVDDEIAMVNLCKEILTANGYHVLTANNAAEALEVLKNNTVEMLISDVIMPGMDGYQLAAKTRELNSNIKILLISGYTDNRQAENIGSKFEEKLLQKPFVPEALLVRIRKILDENQASDRKQTILVMDDDENIQKLFEINLKKLNYESIFANDGAEAISIYRDFFETSEIIDIVILDISVPGGIGGKEAAEKILAIDPNARLIVSSGDVYGSEMTNCQEYGFKAVLEKDFDREQMRKIFDQVLLSN